MSLRKHGTTTKCPVRAVGLTPLQLFVVGTHKLQKEGKIAEDFLKAVDETYGIDPEGPVPVPEAQETVTVPKVVVPLSDAMQDELTAVDPLGPSSDSDLYERVLQIINYVIVDVH